jgi:plastocyanin
MQFDPEQIYAIIQTVIKWIQESSSPHAVEARTGSKACFRFARRCLAEEQGTSHGTGAR